MKELKALVLEHKQYMPQNGQLEATNVVSMWVGREGAVGEMVIRDKRVNRNTIGKMNKYKKWVKLLNKIEESVKSVYVIDIAATTISTETLRWYQRHNIAYAELSPFWNKGVGDTMDEVERQLKEAENWQQSASRINKEAEKDGDSETEEYTIRAYVDNKGRIIQFERPDYWQGAEERYGSVEVHSNWTWYELRDEITKQIAAL